MQVPVGALSKRQHATTKSNSCARPHTTSTSCLSLATFFPRCLHTCMHERRAASPLEAAPATLVSPPLKTSTCDGPRGRPGDRVPRAAVKSRDKPAPVQTTLARAVSARASASTPAPTARSAPCATTCKSAPPPPQRASPPPPRAPALRRCRGDVGRTAGCSCSALRQDDFHARDLRKNMLKVSLGLGVARLQIPSLRV